MGTLPFALTGGFWILYLLGYHQSVATGVGFIALAGVAAEFGVVMLIYLRHALGDRGPDPSAEQVAEAVREGALLRVRSEEHTSELQSLMRISYAVFCLNKHNKHHNTTTNHIYSQT